MADAEGSVGGLLASILAASSAADALGLPAGASAPADARRAFRRRALRVHPDKCADERAAEAFRVLTDALERYSTGAGAPSRAPQAKKRKSGGAGRSWEDWEAELERREEAERCFARLQSGKYASRTLQRTLRRVEAVAEELDERAGVEGHELLPGPGGADEAGDEAGVARPPLTDEESAERLLRLLLYLREAHCYCYYCVAAFGDAAELRRGCPGVLEEAHEDEDGGGEHGCAGDTGVCDY